MAIFFTALVLAVLFVNGVTDAPNAIASCVTTRSMTPTAAIFLAGICNFSGAVIMAILNSRVAHTVYSIVDLSSSPTYALRSLCAGMCAVIIWTLITLSFGIPTSESHALMSGITGAALGTKMSLSAINFGYWSLVLLGLFLSTLPAFLLARFIYSAIIRLCAQMERRRAMRYFMRAQRFSVMSVSFMHGAQDSQKFMGVLMLGLSLMRGQGFAEEFELSPSVVLVCAATMTLGTLLGGTRIIKTVGDKMVRLDASGGAAANIASSAVLAVCSFFGIPASTTHTKTCAMMGAGSRSGEGLDSRVAKQMFAAWCLTFPICAAIGFLLAFSAKH